MAAVDTKVGKSSNKKSAITCSTRPRRVNSDLPFPRQLFRMLQDAHSEGFDNIISWQANGSSFKIHQPKRFEKEILHLYFNQTKYKSFQRQVNIYGFQRIQFGPDKGGYTCKYFVRENPELCDLMVRGQSSDDHTDHSVALAGAFQQQLLAGLAPTATAAARPSSQPPSQLPPTAASQLSATQVATATATATATSGATAATTSQLTNQLISAQSNPLQLLQLLCAVSQPVPTLGAAAAGGGGTAAAAASSSVLGGIVPQSVGSKSSDLSSMTPGLVVSSKIEDNNLKKSNTTGNNASQTTTTQTVAVQQQQQQQQQLQAQMQLQTQLQVLLGVNLLSTLSGQIQGLLGLVAPAAGVAAAATTVAPNTSAATSSLLSSLSSLPPSSLPPTTTNMAKAPETAQISTSSSTTTTSTTTTQQHSEKCNFPSKLHILLQDAEDKDFENVVSWVKGGTAFKVHDREDFVKKIMPLYFDQTRYESFRRQLNLYGFSRVSQGDDRGLIYHPKFLKGHRSLSEMIKRQDRE